MQYVAFTGKAADLSQFVLKAFILYSLHILFLNKDYLTVIRVSVSRVYRLL